jgi:hypothetical protein
MYRRLPDAPEEKLADATRQLARVPLSKGEHAEARCEDGGNRNSEADELHPPAGAGRVPVRIRGASRARRRSRLGSHRIGESSRTDGARSVRSRGQGLQCAQ